MVGLAPPKLIGRNRDHDADNAAGIAEGNDLKTKFDFEVSKGVGEIMITEPTEPKAWANITDWIEERGAGEFRGSDRCRP